MRRGIKGRRGNRWWWRQRRRTTRRTIIMMRIGMRNRREVLQVLKGRLVLATRRGDLPLL